MSQSLASAKKRRAPIQSEPLKSIPTQNSNINPAYNATTQPGLTLPQVIHIIDKRLTSLEKFASEQKEYNQQSIGQYQYQYQASLDNGVAVEDSNDDEQASSVPTNIKEVVEEFDKRYDMLAEEIVNLKNIVLSLQSYTMEVNKTLMEERGRIYDEIEKQNQPSN
jgi:flagellar biosynthesis component FlhA